MTRVALALALASLFSAGCPALVQDQGALVSPTRSLDRPAAAQLPDAEAFADEADRWRREAQIGVGGAIAATLRDPALVVAQVAHDAALQGLDGAGKADALRAAWLANYGVERDRWPIDVAWRFNEQFVQHREVLDPSTWTFVLHVDDRHDYAPMAVSTLKAGQVPVAHFWEGTIRLWFPWRDHRRDRMLLAGQTRNVRLELRHPSGACDVTWRFRTAF